MQNDGFRLSPEQRRFWLLQQTGPAHRAQCAVIVEGILKPERLRQAVQQVVDRHEILRTAFALLPSMKVPYQVVNDRSSVAWQTIDFTSLPPDKQEIELDCLFEEQKKIPFDLEHGPLLKVCRIKFSAKKHGLLVCLPALCADAVTLGNLVGEIAQSYCASEPDHKVKDDPLQYADFSAWHEELLQKSDEEAASGKQYWHKQDFPSIPPLVLPFARNGKTSANFAPASFSLQMNRDLSARLNQISRTCGVSLLTFLLACWQTLLWRVTRQSEILVGTVFDGRKFDDLRGALGRFAKTLPVHCRFQEQSKFSEIVSQVDQTLRDVSDWEEYFTPENAVDAASLPIAFEFDPPWPKCEMNEAAVSIHKQFICGDRFTIKLRCFSIGDCLGAEFHYDPDKIVAQDIECLAQQFHTMVTDAVDNPQSRIDEVRILSDLERNRIVAEWNDTQTHYFKENCVHHLFEQQAERQPTRTAVIYEDQQLTYGELNARANQLAHYLQSLGVGPETPVGICVERSLEMIVGLFAVLKAGGAYMPLDPLLPKQRLKFLIEDTQVPVLLTQQRLVDNLPEHKARVVCLDRDWIMVASQSEENIVSEVTSKNLAYILFTSGSTGRPKGVMVEHGQLLNYLNGIIRRLELPADASFATVSTFAADLGNTAIFPALSTGGCLHVISLERASDPSALADYFTRYLVDCVKIVPPHLEALLSSSRHEHVLPRQRLVLGGEAASWDLIKRVQEISSDCVILNHYGPTETTVGVTTYRVENGQRDSRSARVPIGRPIANTQIYLLDNQLRPVPIWAPGELYIGGDNVSRGYLNHPDLTAEKFSPDPFSAEPSARLYKTGDVARYLPDGDIEFLGRVDNQIKIRGYRVELEEIEAALRRHPRIRQVAVVARQSEPGEIRIVAYIAASAENKPSPHELRSFLQKTLPEHMVPTSFVVLEGLPLSSNGKINRQALAATCGSTLDLKDAFVAPRTPAENAIASIWADLLKLDQVSVHDNFFDLGGHSLLATQAISRLRNVFQAALPLRTLFEAPTVAGLAKYIDESHSVRQHSLTSSNDTSENYEEIEL